MELSNTHHSQPNFIAREKAPGGLGQSKLQESTEQVPGGHREGRGEEALTRHPGGTTMAWRGSAAHAATMAPSQGKAPTTRR
jgi:hypothetical protein